MRNAILYNKTTCWNKGTMGTVSYTHLDVYKRQISEFMDKYRGNRLVTENFINDCRNTIDGLLGAGAYRKIFHKDDLKPYYVILQLAEALKERLEEAATTCLLYTSAVYHRWI